VTTDISLARFPRADDWPPPLHAVCDRLERALRRMSMVSSVDQLDCVMVDLKRSRAEFAVLMTKLERERKRLDGAVKKFQEEAARQP